MAARGCELSLKLCVIHDLGEALHGDIPAVDSKRGPGQEPAGEGRPDRAFQDDPRDRRR
ncbi:HD domain-containing protein [Cupriavidus sp. CuC1]|uniref:HD domain-containing protein n=1 Tax=Cupriavidus sp. CuC1 TaxID=3373131 RepID=UPI0037D61713